MANSGFKRQIAAYLERGRFQGPVARLAARYWEKRSRPVRPLVLPNNAIVVGIGGATLGGAGKTPVVKQLAKELLVHGARVAIVASGYGAQPRGAVRVLPHHRAERMGDEALELCRALPTVPVMVGRNRQRAVELAARSADVVIVDSLLQTAPERLALSVLVLDGKKPWGSGACPPRGDLRARRDRLLRAADVLLVEGSLAALSEVAVPPTRWSFERRLTSIELPNGEERELSELSGKRLGLLTTLARPERVVERLAELGVEVQATLFCADHGWLTERRGRSGRHGIEVWLTTRKCKQKLGQTFENIPVWVLNERVLLPEQLVELVLDKGVIRTRKAVLESAPCSADP
jgi:tetraacyldisaccharide 4'-kinase